MAVVRMGVAVSQTNSNDEVNFSLHAYTAIISPGRSIWVELLKIENLASWR